MRLLHTSDWHLGRGLHEADLHEAQRHVLERIVALVDEQHVDAVVVAGDVYDRAVPPLSSVQLLSWVLSELCRRVPVVVISGNHDSATRLGFGSSLYRDGLHLRTAAADVGTPVELADEHGPVLVYALPFLDPDAARLTLASGDEPLERTHEAVLSAAMDRVRADLDARRAEGQAAIRSVVVSHAFVVGSVGDAATSDSERDIRVGGTQAVPARVFAGVDYVALGHLHGPQEPTSPDGTTRLRYAGSPLRYSFSEARQDKSVTMVDLGPGGVDSVATHAIAQPRGMSRLSGTLDVLLSDPGLAHAEEHWVQALVTDTARPPEMVARVRQRFPRALVVRHEPDAGPLAGRLGAVADARTADPLEVAEAFVHTVTGADATPDELAVFRRAYESVLADGRAG